MSRAVKKSSNQGLSEEIVQLPSEVPWRKTPARPAAESKQRQMLVCDKIDPVQSNLRPTCSSNPLKVKTLIQVSLAP